MLSFSEGCRNRKIQQVVEKSFLCLLTKCMISIKLKRLSYSLRSGRQWADFYFFKKLPDRCSAALKVTKTSGEISKLPRGGFEWRREIIRHYYGD